MSRISRIVPTTVLTVAALALVAPAAQAKPVTAPVGGPNGSNSTSASTVPSHVDSGRPVSVPASPSNGIDWTSAAIGAGLVGILMLMVAGGVGFRRRGQLAA